MDKGPKKKRSTKRRTYNTRLIRRDFCYRVDEVAELYGLHRQAVRRWLRNGLQRIDDRRPILIHGSELIAYLDAWQSKRKHVCASGEIYCCRCKSPRRPRHNLVSVKFQNDVHLVLSAKCDKCGTRMNQFGSVRKLDHYRSTFIIQTTRGPSIKGRSEPVVMCHLDEEKKNAQLQP